MEMKVESLILKGAREFNVIFCYQAKAHETRL
jgi:hypothetical protein